MAFFTGFAQGVFTSANRGVFTDLVVPQVVGAKWNPHAHKAHLVALNHKRYCNVLKHGGTQIAQFEVRKHLVTCRLCRLLLFSWMPCFVAGML
jgi:hypothetical protein